MKLSELKANPQNPRRISDAAKVRLAKSLTEFGDLSGLVRNVKTGFLVGGHQRIEAFRADGESKIVVTERLVKADAAGTVARGYVETGGTRHAYREVAWPKRKEQAAMISANAQGGEWDQDGLADLLKGLGDSYDYDLTGFDADALLSMGIGGDSDANGPVISPEQARKTLREQFGVPPFSVLDARQGYWQDRKRAWLALGIQSEVGRGANCLDRSASSVGITDPEQKAAWNEARRNSPKRNKPVDPDDAEFVELRLLKIRWAQMVARCTNPKNKDFPHYGGRGIELEERWKSFDVFLADMGRPAAGLTLERADNEKGYCKANCVWATRKEQSANRRCSKR